MITQSDLLKITYDMCRQFITDLYMPLTFPEEEIKSERIVILGGVITDGSRWDRISVRINWCVPDIKGEPNGVRLEEVEKTLRNAFSRGAGMVEGCRYRWRRESTETVTERGMKVHYANLTLKYELLNTN